MYKRQELIASVAESFYFNAENTEGWAHLTKVFENPSLQLTTFSITEKGYSLRDSKDQLTPLALEDMQEMCIRDRTKSFISENVIIDNEKGRFVH